MKKLSKSVALIALFNMVYFYAAEQFNGAAIMHNRKRIDRLPIVEVIFNNGIATHVYLDTINQNCDLSINNQIVTNNKKIYTVAQIIPEDDFQRIKVLLARGDSFANTHNLMDTKN